MPDGIKQLGRRWFEEVWNKGKASAIEEMLSPLATVSGLGAPIAGHAGFKAVQSAYRGAFPDLHIRIDDIIAEDDRVVVRWFATGTHTGDGLGIPPTGKKVAFSGIAIARVQGGKIVEGWNAFDELGMMRQLGVID